MQPSKEDGKQFFFANVRRKFSRSFFKNLCRNKQKLADNGIMNSFLQ